MNNPAIPGLVPPPPGVTPNFTNPLSNQNKIIDVNIAGLVFVLVFFAMRIYTRTFITRSLGWDDYTCIIAFVFVVVHAAATLKLLDYGLGIHAWDVTKARYRRPEYLRWNVVVYTIQIATPAVIKISILLLYLRLFSSSRKLRIATYILIGVVASYMIAFELSLIFGCRPVRKLVTPELRGTCFDIQRHALAQAAVNVATDLLVLFLPIPIVIRLHAPRRQKVALMVMFSLASMSCIASVMRIAYIISYRRQNSKRPTFDPTWQQFYSTFWGLIEVKLAIICSCMPALKPFLNYFSPHLKSVSSKFSSQWSSGFGRSSHHHHHHHKTTTSSSNLSSKLSSPQQQQRSDFVELTDTARTPPGIGSPGAVRGDDDGYDLERNSDSSQRGLRLAGRGALASS